MKDLHNPSPFDDKGYSQSDASYLLKVSKEANTKKPIAIIEVKPHGNTRVPLGTFNLQHPPKGFVLEVNPDPDPPDSMVSKIVSLLRGNRSKQYELMLFLENFGLRTTTVEVWEVK